MNERISSHFGRENLCVHKILRFGIYRERYFSALLVRQKFRATLYTKFNKQILNLDILWLVENNQVLKVINHQIMEQNNPLE